MAAAVGGWSQTNDLWAQFDWAVILIFGDVVEGGVDRHVQSLCVHQYAELLQCTLIVLKMGLRPKLGRSGQKLGISELSVQVEGISCRCTLTES